MQNEWNQILQHIKQWVKEAGEEQLRRMDQPVRINEKVLQLTLSPKWTSGRKTFF